MHRLSTATRGALLATAIFVGGLGLPATAAASSTTDSGSCEDCMSISELTGEKGNCGCATGTSLGLGLFWLVGAARATRRRER